MATTIALNQELGDKKNLNLLKCERPPCGVLLEGKLDGARRAFGRNGHFDPKFLAGMQWKWAGGVF